MFASLRRLSTLGLTSRNPCQSRRKRSLQCEIMERRDMFSVNPFSAPIAPGTGAVETAQTALVAEFDPQPAAADVAHADDGPILIGNGGANQAGVNDKPQVFVDDPQPVEEGNAIRFTIRLDRATDVPVRVHYRTVDGTAIGTQAVGVGDYHATDRSNSLVFMPGETEKTVVVATNDDSVVECAQTLHLFAWMVTSGRPVGIGDAVGVATILDNDGGEDDCGACPNEKQADQNAVRQLVDEFMRDLFDGPMDDAPQENGANENDRDVSDDIVVPPVVDSSGEAFVFFGPNDPQQGQEQHDNADGEQAPQLPTAQDVLEGGSPNIDWSGSWGHSLFDGLTDDEIRAEYEYYQQSVHDGVRTSASNTQPLQEIFDRILRLEGEMIHRGIEFGDDVRPDDVPEDGGFSEEHQRSTSSNERRAEREGFTNTDYARMPFFTQDEIDRAKTAPVEIYEYQDKFPLCSIHGLQALIATYAAKNGGDAPTVGALTQEAYVQGWLGGLDDAGDPIIGPKPNNGEKWQADSDIVFEDYYEQCDTLAAQFGWNLQTLPNDNRAVALDALQQSVQRQNPVMIVYRTNPNSDPVAASEGDGDGVHVAIIQGFTFQDGEQYVIAKQPHNNLDHVWHIDDFLASWYWDSPIFVVSGASD